MSPDHPGEVAGIIASVERDASDTLNSTAPPTAGPSLEIFQMNLPRRKLSQQPQQLNQPTQSTSSSPITSVSCPSSSDSCTSSNSPSKIPLSTAPTAAIPSTITATSNSATTATSTAATQTTTTPTTGSSNFSPFSKILKRKPKGHRSIFSSLLCCFSRFNHHQHHPQDNNHCSSLASNNNRLDNRVLTSLHNSPGLDALVNDKTITQVRNLLPPLRKSDENKMCLVIDLDETLVHSSFKPITNPDFIVPVEIDGSIHLVYVLKRPWVDEFLAQVGELYECVLFTASLAKYADPVADRLDTKGVFRSRLFRESCVYHRGNYVKDLSRLGRDLHRVIIVDNSPASYSFHPDNAVPVASWFDNMSDTELRDLVPFFEKLSHVQDIYTVLRSENIAATTSPQSQNQYQRTGANNSND